MTRCVTKNFGFFDGVDAERSYDYDLGRDVLDVTSSGLPQHRFDVSFEPGVPVAFTAMLPKPEDYVQRGVAFGGRPLERETEPVGGRLADLSARREGYLEHRAQLEVGTAAVAGCAVTSSSVRRSPNGRRALSPGPRCVISEARLDWERRKQPWRRSVCKESRR